MNLKGAGILLPIFRSVCAFANDIANEGGGYIVVGVEEDNGLPIRPVKGIPLEQIEPLGKEMITFNNLIRPIYHPKTSIEEIDGKTVFVIWCPAGQDRPYEVPDDVTVKEKKYNYRVRYNSSSIVPKGQLLRELLDLANVNDTVNETESETENETVLLSQLSKRQQVVLKAIAENDRITEAQMMQKFSVSRATITRATTALKKMAIIIRVGSDRNGSWMIVKKVIGL